MDDTLLQELIRRLNTMVKARLPEYRDDDYARGLKMARNIARDLVPAKPASSFDAKHDRNGHPNGVPY